MSRDLHVDFSLGSSEISAYDEIEYSSFGKAQAIQFRNKTLDNVRESGQRYVSRYTEAVPENSSNVLRVYKLGKKVMRKVPVSRVLGYGNSCSLSDVFASFLKDNALLGLLVLVGTELVQREVAKQAIFLPPVMKTIGATIPMIFFPQASYVSFLSLHVTFVANTTMSELDLKLDLLTYLNWDLDPFIQVLSTASSLAYNTSSMTFH